MPCPYKTTESARLGGGPCGSRSKDRPLRVGGRTRPCHASRKLEEDGLKPAPTPEGRAMRFAKRTNWDLELNPWAKAVAEHRAAGKPLIDLTVSNPTECGFIYDTEAILGALRNA